MLTPLKAMINMNCVYSSYRAVNTLRLGKRNQPVNAVMENNHCWFSDLSKTHKYTVWAESKNFWMLKPAFQIVTCGTSQG
jgi:hypothetical protein